MEIWVYLDGASRGNPGKAGAGVFICDAKGTALAKISRFLGETTNNVAEYQALLIGLHKAKKLKISALHLRSDSELMVKQIKGEYSIRSPLLKPLYLEAIKLLQSFHKFEIAHIPREKNKEADRLANIAIDSHLKSRPFESGK